MKPIKTSFHLIIASLFLFMSASCEKEEKEAIQDRSSTAAVKEKNDQTGKEKTSDEMYSQMWVPSMGECVPTPCMCTDPIIVTPGLEPEQDKLDEAISSGKVTELSPKLFENLFPKLSDKEIEAVLSGKIGLCKSYNEEIRTSFYFGYEKKDGVGCKEAKNEKEARKWVRQLRSGKG